MIADMTDPLLTSTEANALFAVLLQQFKTHPYNNKLAVIEQAHR